MSRSAPAGGYAFQAEEAFRKRVWDFIGPAYSAAPVLLMPSSEGLEIETVLQRGFQQSALHVVDRNPAIVASLKRRYPQIHTYGVTLERAHERLAATGIALGGASIDLTTNATWDTSRTLGECADAQVWRNGARIVVNVLRGREETLTGTAMKHFGEYSRLAWINHALAQWEPCGVTPTRRDAFRAWVVAVGLGEYCARVTKMSAYVSSNGQSFLTICLVVRRLRDILRAVKIGTGQQQRPAMDHLAYEWCTTNFVAASLNCQESVEDSGVLFPGVALQAAHNRKLIYEGYPLSVDAGLMDAAVQKLTRYGFVFSAEVSKYMPTFKQERAS